MTPTRHPAGPAGSSGQEPYEFSLVLGGPLFQIVRRAHLSDDALDLSRRRILAITLFAWAPLLLLSALEGRVWGSPGQLPFLLDVSIHARLLVALPLLIWAELIVHRRLRLVVRQFMDRGLISAGSRARFDAAVASALRLRNSVVAEIVLLAIVYVVFAWYVWPQFKLVSAHVSSWYADAIGNQLHLTSAGRWRLFVSLPLFQFMLLRWYYRIFIWIRLLWQVSRCELSLVPTHPDRVGGLGFLAQTPMAFAPLLAAHGVVVAGLIANPILFYGSKLPDFKDEIVAVVAVSLVLVLVPLLFFVAKLAAAKRLGLREYGNLAQRYVREFDLKWLRGGAPANEALVGSADIQSLADLGNSFELVRSMRFAPITRDAVLQLLVITLLPLAPLVLTMIPFEEVMRTLFKVLM
jgi:hypothetical protein